MRTYNPYKLFRFCSIPNWLMQRQEVSFGAKCLFGQLTQHAGEDGFCFPSQKTLAKELGCSVRHIKRLLAELKQHKLIATVRDNTHQTNSYVFLVHPWMSSTKEETRPVVEIEEVGDIPEGTGDMAGDIAGDQSVPSVGTNPSPIKDPIKQQTERRQGKSPGATKGHEDRGGYDSRAVYEQVKQKNPFVDFPSLDWIEEQYRRFKERNPESPVKLDGYIKGVMENIAIKARKEVPSEGAMEGG